jgi:hypothetical protein
VPSWESEGVDNHEGDEKLSQRSFPSSFSYLILTADITGLVGNLKSCSPSMYQLYSILRRRPEGQITQEEINIASGKRPLTAKASAEFLGNLEAQSENIKNAFARQQEQAAVCLHRII